MDIFLKQNRQLFLEDQDSLYFYIRFPKYTEKHEISQKNQEFSAFLILHWLFSYHFPNCSAKRNSKIKEISYILDFQNETDQDQMKMVKNLK